MENKTMNLAVVSISEALESALTYWRKARKVKIEPLTDCLTDGCGILSLTAEGFPELLLKFPLFSRVGGVDMGSVVAPDLDRRFITDRLDLVAFLDSTVADIPLRVSYKDASSDFIIIPVKGIVATVPASLIYKSATVRFILAGMSTQLGGLYKQIFDTLGDAMKDDVQ
jgi:hypothetical protein